MIVPEPVVQALHAGLRRLAREDAATGVSEAVLLQARGLPRFAASTGRAEDLSRARRTCWRFLLLASDGALSADVDDGGFLGVQRGPSMDALVAAAGDAEAAGAEGEARLLTYPVIGREALWISGVAERLWPLVADGGERDWFELRSEWAARLAAAARSAVEPGEPMGAEGNGHEDEE